MITADAGYHSEANLRQLAELKLNALIADNGMRKCDTRFATQARHKTRPDPLYDKSAMPKPTSLYARRDFDYVPVAQTCVCPAGKRLYRNGSDCVPCMAGALPSSNRWGSTPILRTLSLRPIMGPRSVHVQTQALQP